MQIKIKNRILEECFNEINKSLSAFIYLLISNLYFFKRTLTRNKNIYFWR